MWRIIDASTAPSPLREVTYAVAFVASAFACALSLLFMRAFGAQLPFLFGTSAVLVSTAWGGVGPGLLATTANLLFTFGVAGMREGGMDRPANMITVIVFDLVLVLSGGVIHRMRRDGDMKAVKLREQDELLSSIFDALPAAMLVLDEQGRVRGASAEAAKLFGYPPDKMFELNIGDLILTTVPPNAGLERLASWSDDEPLTARRHDGRLVMLRVATAWTTASAGRLLSVLARDVTSEMAHTRRIQELQDELIHMARLTALGEMGTAIAHELNQPLSAATNYLGAARRMLDRLDDPKDALIAASLADASKEVLRAGTVLRRLRSFVSRGAPDHQDAEVREMVTEAALLARLIVREAGADLVVHVDAGTGWVCADRVQIQQVILNLVRNAAEAMDGAVSRKVVLHARRNDDEVVISVRDTGPGIDRRTAGRLFEPFNTSKPDGMGVGLAISRNIIEAHGGRIWLAETPGSGADFQFSLPRSGAEEAADAA